MAQDVIINEIMSSNDSYFANNEDKYYDWIELYNTSDKDIIITNYALTDNSEKLRKWLFPEKVLKAHSFIIVFASGKDSISDDELHTNFKISQAGEPLILTNSRGNIISSVNPVFIPNNQSYGCISDGSDTYCLMEYASPAKSNNQSGAILCSKQSGFYKNSFDLVLYNSDTTSKIYYTLNGSTPSLKSRLYKTPISINEKNPNDYSISKIPTTPLIGDYPLETYIWKEPQSVYQGTVVRYALFKNDSLQSNIYTKNYFIDPEINKRYKYPIISIAIDSFDLFDYDSGIYIPGKRFDENGFNWWPEGNYLNKSDDWERKAHISYINNIGQIGFETNAGLKVRGQSSASYPQKSFNVYFRKEYGSSSIEYPIFSNSKNNKFKRLILRNGGTDFIYSHFKDAMLQKLIEPLGFELQEFSPSVVFINGEYWGIYNIREKYDKYYFKYKYGIPENEINVLEYCGQVEEGSADEYDDLIDFIKNNDISIMSNYNYICNKIDIENFTYFQIAEIYFANSDWPCNNFKIWKDNEPESKWRFLIYDFDASFGYDHKSDYATLSMEQATSMANVWPNCECSNVIFRNLLKNDSFRNYFIEKFEHCLKTFFLPENIIELIDEFESLYEPEIQEHIDRWNYPANITEWKHEIYKLKEFALERPCYMQNNLISYFELDELNFDCKKSDRYENDIISIYPNPSNGNFDVINNSPMNIEEANICIINLQGQIIHSFSKAKIPKNDKILLDLPTMKTGLYILKINSNYLDINKKIQILNYN